VEKVDHSSGIAIRYLCKTQFYKGRCDGAKRTGKKSLGGHTQDQDDSLDRAEKAMELFMQNDKDGQPGGMDMIYYFPIILSQISLGAEGDTPTLGQVVSQALSLKSCPFARIVYVAYHHELIFDRYQDGLLIADLGVLFNDSKRSKSISVVF
jgi:hypothetical protein